MARIQWAFMCYEAGHEQGRPFVRGIFLNLLCPGFPCKPDKLVLFGLVNGQPQQTVNIDVSITLPDGKVYAEFQQPVTCADNGSVWLINQLTGIAFVMPGVHIFRLVPECGEPYDIHFSIEHTTTPPTSTRTN